MVKYYAKGSVHTVFFTPKEVVFSLFKPAEAGDPRSSLGQQQDRQPGLSPGPHSKFTRGKLTRANEADAGAHAAGGSEKGMKVLALEPQEHRVGLLQRQRP